MTPRPSAPTNLDSLVRTTVQGALGLLGVVAFLILELATDVPRLFHGTPKQNGFAIAMMCFIPVVILQLPVRWVFGAWLRRKLQKTA